MKALLLDRADMYLEEESSKIKAAMCEHEVEASWIVESGEDVMCLECTKCNENDSDILAEYYYAHLMEDPENWKDL